MGRTGVAGEAVMATGGAGAPKAGLFISFLMPFLQEIYENESFKLYKSKNKITRKSFRNKGIYSPCKFAKSD